MRIISGDLKGKTIAFLKSSVTRPLKDSVKENIFNILKHSNLLTVNLKNSNILYNIFPYIALFIAFQRHVNA